MQIKGFPSRKDSKKHQIDFYNLDYWQQLIGLVFFVACGLEKLRTQDEINRQNSTFLKLWHQ